MLLASRGLVLALGLLHQSLLAYQLLPAGRGAYAVCVLLGELGGAAFALGACRGAQFFVMKKRLSVSQGVSVAFAICLAGSAVACLAALPLIHSGLAFFLKADVSAFYCALLLIPASSLAMVVLLQLEGLRRFGPLAWLVFARSALTATGILLLVWALGLGVEGAVLALALGHMAMIGGGLAELRRCGLSLQPPSRESARQVLRYGLRAQPARVGQAVDPRMGALLLGMAAGRADIGLFNAGHGLVTRVLLIPAAFSAWLLPRVADDAKPELVAFCARIAWWFAGALLLAWVAVSQPLLPLLLSDAFAPAVPLTWIMAIGVLAYAGTEVFAAWFRGTNRPQVFSLAVWAGLAANAGLFFAFYPAWGLQGAAWALTGGLALRAAILWRAFHRATGLPATASLLLRRADLSRLRAATENLWPGRQP